jgi:uncharacterized protein (TIGR03000 family)
MHGSGGGGHGGGGFAGGTGFHGHDFDRGFFFGSGYYYPGYYDYYRDWDYYGGYDHGYYSAAPQAYPYYVSYYDDSGAAAEGPRGSTALLIVRVPDPDADIWFNGTKTNQRGSQRLFESPDLERGRDYSYEVRARWTADGQAVEETRTIEVHAGDRLTMNFPKQREPEKLVPAKPSP